MSHRKVVTARRTTARTAMTARDGFATPPGELNDDWCADVVSSPSTSSVRRARDESTKTREQWFQTFEQTFIFRERYGVADAFDFDDVLYFVRDDDEVFVRRWSEGMVIDIDDAAFVDVDWRATTKLNACAHSAYEVVIGQFSAKDRSDLMTTARVRAYASPFYTELNELAMPTKNVGRYPLLCFTFDDALTLDAARGNTAYVTLKRTVGNARVKYSATSASTSPSASSSAMMEMDGEEGADVVFSTHAALSDETPTKLGRALLETVTKSPKRGRLALPSPKRIIASPVRAVRKLLGTPKTPKGGGSHDPRSGVELYPAGDGKFAVRSLLAPCADIVYEIASTRNGAPFGSVFA